MHNRAVAAELRALVAVGGGFGTLILTSALAPPGLNISTDAAAALMGAAYNVGFNAHGAFLWRNVVDAVVAGCLPDLLSDAIAMLEGYDDDEG